MNRRALTVHVEIHGGPQDGDVQTMTGFVGESSTWFQADGVTPAARIALEGHPNNPEVRVSFFLETVAQKKI